MAFNINEFRSELKYDGARPNLFNIAVTFPNLVEGSSEASSSFTFKARSAQLPGTSIGSITLPYFGRDNKIAGDRSFPDWTVSVINDEDFDIRNAIQRWSGIMNSIEGNRRHTDAIHQYKYQADVTVNQYGKDGTIIKKMKLVGAFPVDMSPISLDWGTKDQVEEFSVTFTYQYFTDETTN